MRDGRKGEGKGTACQKLMVDLIWLICLPITAAGGGGLRKLGTLAKTELLSGLRI